MSRWISLILLILVLAGCESGVIIVTPTPAPDPTPTREVWDYDCLPEGIAPIHQSPCPDAPPLVDVELFTESAQTFFDDPNRWASPMMIAYNATADAYFIDLDNGAGFSGVRIHGLELESGRCYVVQLTGESNLNGVGYFDGLSNFAAIVRVHTSSGEVIRLGQTHTFKRTIDGENTLTAPQDWFWGLYSNAPTPTLVVDVGILAQYAIAKPGNYVRIDAAYVYRTNDNGHCAGIPGV
jgi:hypothetical protein